MSLIGLGLNLLLAALLLAALGMGWRLNRRLQALRDSHDGFAVAVRELNAAAARAEQGLADLRAATDEAADYLADRIEKGRTLAGRLERLASQAPAAIRDDAEPDEDIRRTERLGAILSAARDARQRTAPKLGAATRALGVDEDLFEDAPAAGAGGARR